MRIAVVAGPAPGHAFPAAALCVRLRHSGHSPVLLTGKNLLDRVRADGVDAVELPGVALAEPADDTDAGFRLHSRAAGMAPALAERLAADRPEVLVADTLTVAGGFAAELVGVPWVELLPHPLYLPSVALPPPGSGLAPGRTPLGRARDSVLRRLHARSVALGRRQRAAARASIGLPALDPGPAQRLVATLWELEPPRPDWPAHTDVVGPLVWDPAQDDLQPPPGDGPLVFVSASTAEGGRPGLLPTAMAAVRALRDAGVPDLRLAATVLPGSAAVGTDPAPAWAAVGEGRQAPILDGAAVVVAGGGHGVLTKALLAGVPMVLVPGGGDQRDLARRAARLGAAVVIERPLSAGRLARAIRRALTDPDLRAAARTVRAGSGPYADPVRLCETTANRAG